MRELELLEHYKRMRESNIMLDFQGAISQDILVEMVELIKNKFSRAGGRSNIAKKIFPVFIEMAQNIAKYSAERSQSKETKTDVGAGIIVVIERTNNYTIISGNLVANHSIPRIVEHCRKINLMNNEELRLFYKKQIRSDRKKGEEGAGLGLIEIVRKSGNPVTCKVTPIDGLNSFLVLSVKIQEEEKNG